MAAEDILQETDDDGGGYSEINRQSRLKKSAGFHLAKRHDSSMGFEAQLKILAMDESSSIYSSIWSSCSP